MQSGVATMEPSRLGRSQTFLRGSRHQERRQASGTLAQKSNQILALKLPRFGGSSALLILAANFHTWAISMAKRDGRVRDRSVPPSLASNVKPGPRATGLARAGRTKRRFASPHCGWWCATCHTPPRLRRGRTRSSRSRLTRKKPCLRASSCEVSRYVSAQPPGSQFPEQR